MLLTILQQRNAWQVIDSVQRLTDPGRLADTAGYASWLDVAAKVQLLETLDPEQRLAQLLETAKAHLAELEVTASIAQDVREGMDKSQREFLLRQQLAAIRKELGDDEASGTADYRSRVDAADLPEPVREAALREVGRPERAGDQSPSPGGSAPGWTPCSTCPGTPARTLPTSRRPAPSSTLTTPGSTT